MGATGDVALTLSWEPREAASRGGAIGPSVPMEKTPWGHQEEIMGRAMEGVTSKRVPRSRLEVEGEQEQRVSLQHHIRPHGSHTGSLSSQGAGDPEVTKPPQVPSGLPHIWLPLSA